MDFPITTLLDAETSYSWLLRHFHPGGLKCLHCGAGEDQARHFRTTKRSQVPVYRCKACQNTYTLYSATVFQGTHLRPQKIVLLLRGIFKGETSQTLAHELKIARQTAHHFRHAVQANVLRQQPQTALPDAVTETDELYQHASFGRAKQEKQAKSTLIRMIYPAGGRYGSKDMALMRMTWCRLLAPSVAARNNCAYAL